MYRMKIDYADNKTQLMLYNVVFLGFFFFILTTGKSIFSFRRLGV